MKEFDIVVLSETLFEPNTDVLISKYRHLAMPKKCQKHKHGGVHGICVFVRDDCFEYVHTIDDTYSESVFWLKLDKEYFGKDIVLGGVYIAPEGSKYHDADVYDIICEDIINISCLYTDLPVCLIGDFNSRTGQLNDFLSFEDCISSEMGFDAFGSKHYVSEHNLESLGIITQRINSDNFVNNNGRKLIELCKGMDLKIANGRFGSDKGQGDFTCMKSNGNSTIDYVVLSTTLMPHVTSFEVSDFDQCLSDVHKLIEVSFELPTCSSKNAHSCYDKHPSKATSKESTRKRIKWDSTKVGEYRESYQPVDIERVSAMLDEVETSDLGQDNMDLLCKNINDLLITPAQSLGMVVDEHFTNERKRKTAESANQPWFSRECERKRSEYMKLKNKWCKIKTVEAVEVRKREAKKYKNFIRKTRRNYCKKIK